MQTIFSAEMESHKQVHQKLPAPCIAASSSRSILAVHQMLGQLHKINPQSILGHERRSHTASKPRCTSSPPYVGETPRAIQNIREEILAACRPLAQIENPGILSIDVGDVALGGKTSIRSLRLGNPKRTCLVRTPNPTNKLKSSEFQSRYPFYGRTRCRSRSHQEVMCVRVLVKCGQKKKRAQLGFRRSHSRLHT